MWPACTSSCTRHESGNVSAHTTHLVHSALSDPYYAYSAGLNGLAGRCTAWPTRSARLDHQVPAEILQGHRADQGTRHQGAVDTLNAGQVVPGYGHAVLRKTDRATCRSVSSASTPRASRTTPCSNGRHDFRSGSGGPDRACKTRTPGERRCAVGRHPVVLRPQGMGLLHCPVRRRPGPWLHGQHHLGPRPRLRHRASEVRYHRDAGEMGCEGGRKLS